MANEDAAGKELDGLREEILYEAVDRFDYGSELAKRVYHLGEPRFTDGGATAWIRADPNGAVAFWFNRSFFDALSDDELLFVLLHEALHLAFRHHARRQDRDPKRWNLATDLVCNAWLLDRVGFGNIRRERFRRFLRSSLTFENLPIVPVHRRLDVTAEEVYELLRDSADSSPEAAANLSRCDEHTWADTTQDAAPEQVEARQEDPALDELSGELEKLLEEWQPGWADDPVGDQRAISIIRPPVIDWESTLRSRLASASRLTVEQRWAPPNRKVAWLYPRVLLPGERQAEIRRTSVLMAVDASGSIGRGTLERLLALARSLPEGRFEVDAISFDTEAYPLDIRAEDPRVLGAGGTWFQAIEAFALTLPRYPDLVVVLTDGLAPRPEISRPGRWLWLITEDGTDQAVRAIGQTAWIRELGSACRGDRPTPPQPFGSNA